MRHAINHFVIDAFHTQCQQVAHFLIGQAIEDVDHLFQRFFIRNGLFAEQQHAIVAAASAGEIFAIFIGEKVAGVENGIFIGHTALVARNHRANVPIAAGLAIDKVRFIIRALANGKFRMDRALLIEVAAQLSSHPGLGCVAAILSHAAARRKYKISVY